MLVTQNLGLRVSLHSFIADYIQSDCPKPYFQYGSLFLTTRPS